MKEYTENFLEIESVDEANNIDLTIYSKVKTSDVRNRYIFKRRAGKGSFGTYKQHIGNFLEINSVEDANTVNLEVYSFDKFSESRNRYMFSRRAGR